MSVHNDKFEILFDYIDDLPYLCKMKRKMDEITVDNRFKGDEAEV